MPSSPDSPRARYQAALAQGFVPDPAQEPAVAALERCYQALHGQDLTEPPRGVYLWGPVGRGKTWLMDQFQQSLQVPALRQHFHHFMRNLHQELFRLTGTPEPLAVFAEQLAARYRVLCFDELFVSDIADAMLLGGVFQSLFERGVVLVATSNQPPESLYTDGFNREQFLPAIAALQEHMDVIQLAGAQDHRLHQRGELQRYWVRSESDADRFAALFRQLTGEAAQSSERLVNGRRLYLQGAARNVLWTDYQSLCEQPFAALDYIALCDQATAILVSGVPDLSAPPAEVKIARGTEDGASRVVAGDRQLQALSRFDDGVRRFIALVDECYDRGVALYLEAEVPLEELYTEGALMFAFQRTLSRLRAMQYEDYGKT